MRMKRVCAVMALLLSMGALGLTGCVIVQSAPAQPRREVRNQPYPVVYLAVPPTIDGKLDDEAWRKAVPLSTIYTFEKYGCRVDVVTAYMAWDDDNLYLAVKIKDKDLYIASKKHDGPHWISDVAELFIKPRKDRLEVYEMGFNMSNTFYDVLYIGLGGSPSVDRFIKYESGAIAKATYEGTINDWSDVDQGWSLEVAIPLKAFSRPVPDGPKPGDRWAFNVAGYDWSCYRARVLMFTSCDGSTERFAECELFPEMEFMAP